MGHRISKNPGTSTTPVSVEATSGLVCTVNRPENRLEKNFKRKSEKQRKNSRKERCQDTIHSSLSATTDPINICKLANDNQAKSSVPSGSVVITIRMLKMESNDLDNFIQQQQQQQLQSNQINNQNDLNAGTNKKFLNNNNSNNSNDDNNNNNNINNSDNNNTNCNSTNIELSSYESTAVATNIQNYLSNNNNNNNNNNIKTDTINNSLNFILNSKIVNKNLENNLDLPSKNVICDTPTAIPITVSEYETLTNNVTTLNSINKILNNDDANSINASNDNKNNNYSINNSNNNGDNRNELNDGNDTLFNTSKMISTTKALPTQSPIVNSDSDLQKYTNNQHQLQNEGTTSGTMEQSNQDVNNVNDKKNIHEIKTIPVGRQHTNNTCDKSTDCLDIEKQKNRITNVINVNNISPYPHHIPMGNLKHECDVNCSTPCGHCQHKKAYLALAQNSSKSCTCCTSKEINKEEKMKKANWSLKFNCSKLKNINPLSVLSSSSSSASASSASSTQSTTGSSTAVKTPSISTATGIAAASATAVASVINNAGDISPLISSASSVLIPSNAVMLDLDLLISMEQQPLLDFTRFNPDAYPTEDCDKRARLQRAIEIEEGIDPPPGFVPSNHNENLQLYNSNCISTDTTPTVNTNSSTQCIVMMPVMRATDTYPKAHSQEEFLHCLVRDLEKITNCSFYWGKMDRYEAERLLEGKPEGTFLLRDSAQEDYLFSVSFRKYGRSLHARIEQFNHKFSFDCRDPGVYTSSTVTGLLEHYKDPACVMFFEPALTLPLNRNFAFSLQQLCRATIVSNITYDGINETPLPNKLKSYLKEYHYKQRLRTKRFD